MYRLIPRWSTLRGAGNSSFSRFTVLTPVFGYVILYLDVFRDIPGLSVNQEAEISNFRDLAPIYMIYFGLFLFSIGVIIFQYLCSEVVKKYEDQNSYIISVAQNISSIEYETCLNSIKAHRRTSLDAKRRADILLKSINLSTEIRRENIIFVLSEYYGLLNSNNYLGRLISSVFIVAGSTLIILPTIMTFVSIIRSLGR